MNGNNNNNNNNSNNNNNKSNNNNNNNPCIPRQIYHIQTKHSGPRKLEIIHTKRECYIVTHLGGEAK